MKYDYSNACFTILQAVVETVAGHANASDPDYFATYVNDNVFTPMGIDTAVFSPVPDDAETRTLSYYGSMDVDPGNPYQQTNFVGAAGWITSATEAGKFLNGLRGSAVLSESTKAQMFEGQLGWYTYNGLYGQYFHHEGDFGGDPGGIRAAVVRLTNGYDCFLAINSANEYLGLPNIVELVIRAFEANRPQG